MDPHTDTSYQDDILKVKRIWNDLKDVEKQSMKKSQPNKLKNKHENIKKTNPTPKSTKAKDQPHQTKSLINTHQQKVKQPGQIIEFSTLSHQDHQSQKHPNSPSTNHANLNSKYIETYNFRTAIEEKDKQLSLLRVTNQRFKQQIHRLQKQIEQKDHLIFKYKNRQNELLGSTSKFASQKIEALSQSVEYMNYKNDSRRLLKMLETTQEYQFFAKSALDDDGVRFLSSVKKKSRIDGLGQHEKTIHFCSCNAEFIPEDNFWVPEKVYDFSRDYIKKNKGQAITESELELLLYELNKIWRQRQKRITNWLKSSKQNEVGKYKRKMQEIKREDEKKKNSQRE